MSRQLSFALLLLACSATIGTTNASEAASGLTQLAQAQTEPSQPAAPATAAPDPATPDATAADAPEEPIGNVATVVGSASVIRNDKTTPLKVKDDIYLNDVVQTGANSALGITFIDATTFNLKASTKITIDNYVYEDGGKSNAAIFDVAKGTAAFVAASVAKTGDMKITTPTATLGIRGTTGLVEVPEGAAANNPNNVAVKLYPDADGRVGRIEVNDRAGARLGFLTQGASGFTIRPGAGGARFAAVPLAIPQAVMLRDQGFVRQLHSTQNVGRQVVFQQREFRRANPSFVNPNRPIRQLPARPAAARMVCPDRSGPDNTAARSVEPSRPAAAERPARATRSAATAGRTEPPGTAAARPAQSSRTAATAGQLNRPGQQQQARRRRQPRRTTVTPGLPAQPGLPPRAGQPPRSDLPPQPGLPPRAGQPQQPYCRAARRAAGTAGTAEQVRRARAAARARTAARARRSGSARRAASGTARRAEAACARAATRQAAAERAAVVGRLSQVSRRSQLRSFCMKLRGCCRVRLSTVSTATGSISSANDGGPAGCASSTA